jgi:hypothetical protein
MSRIAPCPSTSYAASSQARPGRLCPRPSRRNAAHLKGSEVVAIWIRKLRPDRLSDILCSSSTNCSTRSTEVQTTFRRQRVVTKSQGTADLGIRSGGSNEEPGAGPLVATASEDGILILPATSVQDATASLEMAPELSSAPSSTTFDPMTLSLANIALDKSALSQNGGTEAGKEAESKGTGWYKYWALALLTFGYVHQSTTSFMVGLARVHVLCSCYMFCCSCGL